MRSIRLSRRGFIKGLAIASGAGVLGACQRSREPSGLGRCPPVAGEKIRWIVPFGPGGGYDTSARLIEPFLEEKIEADIMIENLPGAGGLIASKTLREAQPDGLTLGMVSGPGLLTASLMDEPGAPNPASDFTVLGRVSGSYPVWAVGERSPFRTIEELLKESERRPILFAMSDVGGNSFGNIAVAASLLGIDVEYIGGFSGSVQAAMAAVRGDADLVSYNFESIAHLIKAGDLRPVLQINDKPLSSDPMMESVPLLSGEKGIVVRRSRELGRDVGKALAVTDALMSVLNVGELVVAPLNLEASLARCYAEVLHEVLTDPAFVATVAASNRTLHVASAEVARATVQRAAEKAKLLRPFIEDAIKKVRG